LHAKAKLALPSRGWRKKLRQSLMLKVRKPGYRRVWQTPTKKPCRFENNVNLSLPEFSYRRIVKPERKSCGEAGTASIESCGLHGLDAWDARKSLEIGGIVPLACENNRRNLALAVTVQGRK
jgi:hypothetical protein